MYLHGHAGGTIILRHTSRLSCVNADAGISYIAKVFTRPVPVTAMLAAKRAGIPYIVTFHTGGHSQQLRNALRSAQWRLVGPLLREASALIAVSQFEALTMTRQARLEDGSVIVIRNGGTLPEPAH